MLEECVRRSPARRPDAGVASYLFYLPRSLTQRGATKH